MKVGHLAVAVAIVVAAIIATGFVLTLEDSHGSEKEVVQPNEGLVYNGTMQELVKILDTESTILFNVNGGEYTSATPTCKDAGTVNVGFKVVNDKGDEKSSGSFDVTISKRLATISADTLSKEYGNDDPVLTTTTTGIVGDDQIVYSLSREEGESVGTYRIHVSGESIQGNYNVVFNDSVLTIKERTVDVVANDATKSFGSDDPELTANVSGLLDGDSIEYSITREPGEDSGSYKIIVSGESIQGNYSVRYQNAVFYIYAQIVTVKANSTSKLFGDSDPALTATVTGGSNIKYTISRQAGEEVGTYEITVTGDVYQGNYMVVYEDGLFSIRTSTSSWTSLPTSNSFTFDGYTHDLITGGTATGGTAYYRLSTDTYSSEIPTASEPGTYTIYYMVKGDDNHADTRESSLTVTISDYIWNGTAVKEPQLIDGKYRIYLASELAWISKYNTSNAGFDGKTFVLMHDISLLMKQWMPIGGSAVPFKGNFDGNGYTISQLHITSGSYIGLFGYTQGGTIKGLTIDVAEVSGSEHVGVLAGYLGSTASGIKVSHSNITGNRYVGGIAGYQTSPISNSAVEYVGVTCERIDNSYPYNITYLGNNAGGVVGLADADITNCKAFHAVISSYRDVGGIAGNIQESVESMRISGCDVSYATIIVDIDGGNAGIVSGRVQNNTIIENNTNLSVSIKYTSSASSGTNDSPHEFTGEYDYILVKSDNTIWYSKDSAVSTSGELHQITLNNVTINAAAGIPAIQIESGAVISIVIKGTVTLVGGKNADGINVPEGAEVTIGGSGTLYTTGNEGKEYANLEGYKTDSSDYLGTGGSGIGNHGVKGFTILTGKIVISNLNALYAYGYGDQAYGIGGDGATVIIQNNSTIKEARGGFQQSEFKTDTKYGKSDAEGGPAIGGATVTIENSVIELAQGGSKAAGIGAGYWRGVEITITHSTLLDIRGGNASAAIGSSRSPESGTVYVVINIDDSTINAIGGYYAAGIGSGYDTYCGTKGLVHLTINILGYSNITATGGKYGAAIGTGFHSAILYGSIDDTVICDVHEGTESYYKYSWIAQDIGFGLVDSAKEAKYMVEDGITEMSFKVGGTSIENPYDPDRLERVKAEYPAP